uniref:PK196R n=1 Tax=African swine fever virus TaxID=10497 RepID=A0A6G7KU64_ASF
MAQKVPQIQKQRRVPPNLVLPEATPAKPMLLRPCIPGCSIQIWYILPDLQAFRFTRMERVLLQVYWRKKLHGQNEYIQEAYTWNNYPCAGTHVCRQNYVSYSLHLHARTFGKKSTLHTIYKKHSRQNYYNTLRYTATTQAMYNYTKHTVICRGISHRYPCSCHTCSAFFCRFITMPHLGRCRKNYYSCGTQCFLRAENVSIHRSYFSLLQLGYVYWPHLYAMYPTYCMLYCAYERRQDAYSCGRKCTVRIMLYQLSTKIHLLCSCNLLYI